MTYLYEERDGTPPHKVADIFLDWLNLAVSDTIRDIQELNALRAKQQK